MRSKYYLTSSNGLCSTTIPLLCNGELLGGKSGSVSIDSYREKYLASKKEVEKYLHTLALGQADPRLLLTNNEHVVLSCSERVINHILDMHNIEAPVMAFTMGNHTDTTHIAPTSSHSDSPRIKGDELGDFPRRKLNLDRIVDSDSGIRVSNPIFRTDRMGQQIRSRGNGHHQNNGPTTERVRQNLRSRIMRNQEWDSAFAQLHPLYFRKLVFCLLRLDSVHGEAAFGVIYQPEMLAGLLDRDDVHVACRVGDVGAHFSVYFDQALHDDGFRFARVEGVL